ASRMPLVVVKGGASDVGARAAASHTGSLATDDHVFDGACRQAGVVRAATIEEAYEAAATFATQPLPKGPNVCVVTTAGGWGVVTADAVGRTPNLRLLPMPADLKDELDRHLPPRWSRNNPIDLAGGETKDTIPTVLEIAARHPAVDSVVFLGMGIQGNQGRMEREGPFYPDHGLERIVAYHERQDRRFTEAAAALAAEIGKPILTATELAITDRDNPAVAGCRESGQLCYASANRAVTALAHLWQYARYRQRRRHPGRTASPRGEDGRPQPARDAGAVGPPGPRTDRRTGRRRAPRRSPARAARGGATVNLPDRRGGRPSRVQRECGHAAGPRVAREARHGRSGAVDARSRRRPHHIGRRYRARG